MNIRCLLLPLLIVAGSAYADGGSKYIVVKGSTVQCPEWHNRILEVVEVKDNEYANLLGIPLIEFRPLKPKAILNYLVDSIVQLHKYEPESLSVEVLESNIEYRAIVGTFMMSLDALVKGKCLRHKTKLHEKLEKDIEKIRVQELSRHLSMNLRNKQVCSGVSGESGRHRVLG
jgi:hypothetical protein